MARKEASGFIEPQVLGLAEKEWFLFRQVQNRGGPADCQSERDIFLAMRSSQFMAWTPVLWQSYERDLDEATAEGRNLLTEKYAHMMRYTFPEEYEQFKDRLPVKTEEKALLIEAITAIVLEWAQATQKKYPWLMEISRPIYAAQDHLATSIETYTRGELETYSERTLRLLLSHYMTMKEKNINLHEVTEAITARLYGYESLKQADRITGEQLRAAYKQDCGHQ